MLISLLQPSPETFDLFDDVCLMAGRKVVYLGAREKIEPFFASLGLICPDSKQTADFLSEVTLKSDQAVGIRGLHMSSWTACLTASG